MIPILYESTETTFTSNGLGRLRDCLGAVCVEERNGVYELDFSYPVTGAHFDEITVGRIIGVTHDDTGDLQPFDIVSYERPIDGIVKFHCTHISYRQSFYCVTASNVSVIWPTAFDILKNQSKPSGNPFNYELDYPSGFSNSVIAAFDGLPHSIRSILGGTEGSILDSIYGGGEFEWNRWNVIIHQSRGQLRDFTIRYGVNMLDYNEECSLAESYMSCVPYWTDGTDKVIGDRQTGSSRTVTNRGETIPIDVSDKFESKPTKAQVNAEGLKYLNTNKTALPVQNITVEFARLQDSMPELSNLMTCRLCDSIKVIFPDYNAGGIFKIVKTEWDVLGDKYEKMELGELSTTLAEALGVSSGAGGSPLGGGSGITLITQSYTSVSVPSGLYVKVDSLSNLIDTSLYDLVSMTVKGWSGVAPLQIALGSNGNDVYIMGRSSGTISSTSIVYAFALK